MNSLKIKEYFGNYRGKVVSNIDPLYKGRCKIYIPGIYPEELAKNHENLPWAEPAMSIFGGSWKNERNGDLNIEVGMTSSPHTSKNLLEGAEVWLFFEAGNPQFPIYFAACQAGSGWISEHENQHCINTDNVRIRIDENLSHKRSTTKFDTYNDNNNNVSKNLLKEDVPTRTDIEILNKGEGAINLIVKGNINFKVEGDYFEEITGDRHITHLGNTYYNHKGNTYNTIEGDLVESYEGDKLIEVTGDSTYVTDGNINKMIFQDITTILHGCQDITTIGESIFNYHSPLTINTEQLTLTSYTSIDLNSINDLTITVRGNLNENITKDRSSLIAGETSLTSLGNINLTSISDVNILGTTINLN